MITLRPLIPAAASMSNALNPAQLKHLRALAHDLKPVILMGAKGLTDALVGELDGALEHHELVKEKLAGGDRAEKDSIAAALVERTGAALVQRIGNQAVLFRRNSKKPLIPLPRG